MRMKKAICFILVTVLLFAACSDKDKEKHISTKIYEGLAASYATSDISDYRVIAALYNAGAPLSERVYAPEAPDGRTERHGEYLISLYYAREGGIDVSGYDAAPSLEAVKERIAKPDGLSVYEIFVCVTALRLYGEEFDGGAVTKSLESRQNGVSGGMYEYVSSGDEEMSADTVTTAYGFMVFVMLRSSVTDLNYDNALMYLAVNIGDDNTINDAQGKSSCSATAVTLTALLSSGIPTDGEVSTALLTAIDGFRSGRRYSDRKGEAVSRRTDADVLLCASSAMYGNPFTKER